MDCLTFISNSEWPAVLVLIVFLFRGKIIDLLKNIQLTKATIAGNTLEFRNKMDEAEEISSVQLIKDNNKTEENESVIESDNENHWSKISDWISGETVPDVPPAYIIIKCWNEIESIQNDLLKKYESLEENEHGKLDFFTYTSIPNIDNVNRNYSLKKYNNKKNDIGRLYDFLELAPESRKIIQNLRAMRNEAAHGKENEISMTDALRYRDLTREVVEEIYEKTKKFDNGK